MIQDRLNEIDTISRREERRKEVMNDTLNRVYELRKLVDRIFDECPSAKKKFAQEFRSLND